MTPVVASLALRSLLHGPELPVTVVASFAHAAYLRVDTGAPATDPPTLVTLVTRDGVDHPNALTLPEPADRRPLAAVHRGHTGTVGVGRLLVAGRSYRPVRWRCPVPSLPPVDAAVLAAAVGRAGEHLAARTGPLPVQLGAPLRTVAEAVACDDLQAARTGADRLIGLGPGLTPAGDDLLAGLVAGVRVLTPAVVTAVTPPVTGVRETAEALGAYTVRRAVGRTTDVSVALLCHAANGAVATPAARLLAALTRADGPVQRRIADATDDLLAVGSTSGRDLATGLLTAGEVVGRVSRVTAGPPAATAA